MSFHCWLIKVLPDLNIKSFFFGIISLYGSFEEDKILKFCSTLVCLFEVSFTFFQMPVLLSNEQLFRMSKNINKKNFITFY